MRQIRWKQRCAVIVFLENEAVGDYEEDHGDGKKARDANEMRSDDNQAGIWRLNYAAKSLFTLMNIVVSSQKHNP